MKWLRLFCIVLGSVFLIWFTIPLSLSVNLNLGNLTGLIVSGMAILYGLFMPRIHKAIVSWKNKKGWRWFLRGMLAVACVIAALVVIETACMIRAAGREPATSARPPVLQKGTASLVAYRIFIKNLLFCQFLIL